MRRVARGERKAAALAFIRKAEKADRLWTMTEMAQALDISKQQAWQLLQSLTYSGELERGTRTVVVEDALRLAGGAA